MSVVKTYKTHTFLFMTIFLFVTVGTASLHAAEAGIMGKPALPGEPCRTEPLSSWTPQEKWVWDQVCVGEIADFNKAEGYGGKLDPKKPKEWPESRVLRPEFLETILLHEPYRSALTRHGVHIIGAWFTESLDLSNATLAHQLWLDGCRFEANVALSGLKTSPSISLGGSKFTGKVNMDGLQVSGDLLMHEQAEFAAVDLVGAKIGGDLDMSWSKFTGKVDMNHLQVEGALLMRGGAEFAAVDLVGAEIRAQLAMDGSKFTGKVNMGGLQVSGDLLMRADAEFAEVDLVGAKIGAQLAMDGSKFSGTLVMESLHVEGSLFMRNAMVSAPTPVSSIFMRIGADLDFSGSILGSLDLTGTRVSGEFRLGQNDYPARWQDRAILKLRNTEVGVLQDLPDAWPGKLELDGFTYNRLGGFAPDGTTDMAARDVSWFKAWLGKQRRYSPQPYEQLASVLLKGGYKDKASDILYAGKERERGEGTWLNWLWLTLVKVFIGYGYRIYYALGWVPAFVVLGVLVLRVSKQGQANGMPYGIAYSFDMLLPIVKLRELHYDIELAGWARYYFYFHKLMGYVLASFLIAGLSGLTK